MRRKIDHARDTIMRGLGTDEPWIEEPGPGGLTLIWRKPLRLDEVARMSPTAEVRQRPGRP
jgi:hypothetical protein